MPRPKNATPAVRKHIYINEDLNAQVELLLLNHETGKTKYGAFSKLTERLLREWLRDQQQRRNNLQQSPAPEIEV